MVRLCAYTARLGEFTLKSRQRIIPNIWCPGTADAAAAFYARVFPRATVVDTVTYPTEGLPEFQRPLAGKTLTHDIDVDGYRLTLINAGEEFTPTPALSFFVDVGPAHVDDPRQLIDALWAGLAAEGAVLLELGEHEFSPYYGWVADKFGVTWQLGLTDPAGDPRPFIVPCLLFCGPAQNTAAEAVDAYLDIFPDTEQGVRLQYPAPQGPATEKSVLFTDFALSGQWLAAMDSGVEQPFTFSEGISLLVQVDGQEEIDRLWEGLSAVPEAEACGWLKDRWGVSWQIVPTNMAELMATPGAWDTLLGDEEDRRQGVLSRRHGRHGRRGYVPQ